MEPKLIVSGRFRELAGKLLLGQGYPLHVEARDAGDRGSRQSGIRRIEILLDGTVVRSWDQTRSGGDRALSADWVFDPRRQEIAEGAHEIAVKAIDGSGNVATQTWSFLKSKYADRTEDEILEDSLEFRPDYGLNTDPAHIDQVMHDPVYEPNWEFYDLPLTNEEVAAADLLGEDVSRPWGELVAHDWPWGDSSSSSDAPPKQLGRNASLPADPIARYGATEAAGVYAGTYIGGGAIRVGFTRDAAEHLEQLRLRTRKPLALFEARYSLDYLRGLRDEITGDVHELDSVGIRVTVVSVDVPENGVRVGTKPLTAAQRKELRDRYGPAIRLMTSDGLQLRVDGQTHLSSNE